MIRKDDRNAKLQDDMFRYKLENLIDMRHELVELSKIIDWDQLNV